MSSNARAAWVLGLVLLAVPALHAEDGGSEADLRAAAQTFYGVLLGREMSHYDTHKALAPFFDSEDDLEHYIVDLVAQLRAHSIEDDRIRKVALRSIERAPDGRTGRVTVRLKGRGRLWFTHSFDRTDAWRYYGGAWHVLPPERIGSEG